MGLSRGGPPPLPRLIVCFEVSYTLLVLLKRIFQKSHKALQLRQGRTLASRRLRTLPIPLTLPFFRSIVPPIPRLFFPEWRPPMPLFLHQVSNTPEALTRLLANPQARFDAVRV